MCLTLALSALSCQREGLPEVQKSEPVTVGFYAGNGGTRTQMLENGLSAAWVPGDEIALWAVDASGSYSLSNHKFTTYGIDGPIGMFTSTLDSAMPEGAYTYYSCYPTPASVSGTKAYFTVPSVQDGKAGNGADIMLAYPVTAGALGAISEESDYRPFSMSMKRKMHQFRFWLPATEDNQSVEIENIIITMPKAIVGSVNLDVTDPASLMRIDSGTKELTLNLSEKLKPADDMSQANFACAAVIPYTSTYSDDDFMRLTVYSNGQKYVLDPISLEGRSFLEGHSTPVRLVLGEPYICSKLTIKVGENYIGEALWNVRISSGGTVLYNYANTSGAYSNFSHEEEFLGTSGKEKFESIVNAVANGTATLTFETNRALVDLPMNASMLQRDGDNATLNLGDVPYLLYEDFSNAVASEHNDAYAGSDDNDRNLGGYLLNDYLATDGWNAARYKILEGDCIRINCRYQSGGWVVERMCGRLDTPALKYIKPGVTTEVVVEYDEAFYIPVGYTVVLWEVFDDSSNKVARYHLGTHTAAEGSKIDGLNSGDISGMLYTSPTFASEDLANLHHNTFTIGSAGQSTRIVFMADTTQSTSHIGRNSCYYLYLDNIKVYLK